MEGTGSIHKTWTSCAMLAKMYTPIQAHTHTRRRGRGRGREGEGETERDKERYENESERNRDGEEKSTDRFKQLKGVRIH